MNSYINTKKKREEFRHHLVKMLITKEGEDDVIFEDAADLMTTVNNDNNVLKYYYYITHGIDDIHVAPMSKKLLNKILHLVPASWRTKFKPKLNQVISDAREDYAASIKKSIVDFVLQDPLKADIGDDSDVSISKENYEIKHFPPEFSVKYKKIKIQLKRNLVLYHPCMRKTLDLWHREFR